MATTAVKHHRSEGVQQAASGLTALGAVLLIMGGILDVVRGIMAVANDDVFLNTRDYTFQFDLTSWGWIHLAVGTVAIVVGLGLVVVATWARVLGVGIAALAIVANFLDVPYYPFWSLTLIALYAFVIWALCVVERDREPS
ncbi:DUF7144 family membrane protein [Streptomyces griseorubiginosus]|uniref:DUF7144 family membrane protein n=1 Tax=Streptomyces griseorubiginosus TaxID=67304 RepID=UPI001AD68F06|nr:hypothetical protein [Streptomyces griseorubiginosus]MBO4254370.1 hypothetical protein [Streptomyces griseorubiginosus]